MKKSISLLIIPLAIFALAAFVIPANTQAQTVNCPPGYICTPVMSTPGTIGSLAVYQSGSIYSGIIYNLQAGQSDIQVNSIIVDFNVRPWLYFSTLSLVNQATGQALAPVTYIPTQDNVTQIVSGSDYRYVIGGLNFVVPHGQTVNIVLTGQPLSGASQTGAVISTSIRSVDGAGITSFSPSSSVSSASATPLPSAPTSSSCYQFNANLQYGSTGADVVALQNFLLSNGYDISALSRGIQAKGFFGSQTAAALAKYQATIGITTENWILGPLTRAYLNSICTANRGPDGTASNQQVYLSNTSATVGSAVVSNGSGVLGYSVSFSFTLTAGNNTIYLSSSGTVPCPTGQICASQAPLVFGGNGGLVPTVMSPIANPTSIAGDGPNYFIIPAGSSRQFTVNGSISSPSLLLSQIYTVQVVSVNYGTSPNNLQSNAITYGLDNLKILATFGGGSNNPSTPTTTPSNSTVSATLMDASSDHAGAWGNFGPGHGYVNQNPNDWHWNMTLNSYFATPIRSITILSNNSGEGWSTSADTSLLGKQLYPLVVIPVANANKASPFQQTAYDQSVPVISGGQNFYDLYGQPESTNWPGGKIIVNFTDNTQTTAVIPASAITQVALNSTSNIPAQPIVITNVQYSPSSPRINDWITTYVTVTNNSSSDYNVPFQVDVQGTTVTVQSLAAHATTVVTVPNAFSFSYPGAETLNTIIIYPIAGSPGSGNTGNMFTNTLTFYSSAPVPSAPVPSAPVQQSIIPSVSSISSGGSVKFSFTYPSNTVRASLYLSCPTSVSEGTNKCNQYTDVTSNGDYTVTLFNNSLQPQNVIPNYYMYTSDNPNYAKGVSSQVTIQPGSTPAYSPNPSPTYTPTPSPTYTATPTAVPTVTPTPVPQPSITITSPVSGQTVSGNAGTSFPITWNAQNWPSGSTVYVDLVTSSGSVIPSGHGTIYASAGTFTINVNSATNGTFKAHVYNPNNTAAGYDASSGYFNVTATASASPSPSPSASPVSEIDQTVVTASIWDAIREYFRNGGR